MNYFVYKNQFIMNILAKASNYRGTHPLLGKILVGTSFASAIYATYNHFQASRAEAEISFRKSQLEQPVTYLDSEQLINPPWADGNLDKWLYRRVLVSGRPIHRLSCLVPREAMGTAGYQYVVPLVVQQNKDRTEQYGIILSKGFIPERWKHIGNRFRIEDVSQQAFIGFVSQLVQLQNPSPFKGNAYQQGRLDYHYADLDDFARSSGFVNKKAASLAVIEQLKQIGGTNQRTSTRYFVDSSMTEEYPYAKTEAGALQLPQMPWDFRNKARNYFGLSIASFVVGASIF